MTNAEVVTTCISSGALLVSLVSFYFSALHRKTGMSACLAACNAAHDCDPRYVVYEFALSNNGNRDLMVRNVTLFVAGGPDSLLNPELEIEEMPLVLGAAKVEHVRILVPVVFLNTVADFSAKLEFVFEVFTPKAEFRVAVKKVSPYGGNRDVEFDAKDWKPFKLGKVVN